ncbi:MAG: hypothetical protein H0W19_09755 [Nitrosopumilus sp.]|nr:hypothetical protein [Nitrosopumilus sp.]
MKTILLLAYTWTILIAGSQGYFFISNINAQSNNVVNNENETGVIPQTFTDVDLPTKPESQRVDLVMPSFSNPTNITNPLFPISKLHSAVLLGNIDGAIFRAETTLLPETRVVDLNGTKIETSVSQYTAYLNGRIHEIALDLYAQADDGSVWYFGEDVYNYKDVVVEDTEGTWLAGKDGPAAMIMPAIPKVGDVFRPENIPGNVLEEVEVKSIDAKVEGPFGPVNGAIITEELHMDGKYEDKIFAPKY